MTRTVILIGLNWTRDKDPRLPLGQASLLASLQALPGINVHSISVSLSNDPPSPEQLAGEALMQAGGAPEAVDVALGAYVWGEAYLKALLRALRRQGYRGRIILGGPQISYAGPGLEVHYPEADVFVRGYGEDALARLVKTQGRPAIRGVHVAGGEDRCEQSMVDLSALPSPWLTGAAQLEGQRFVRWETQRGCQFRCAFCQHREPGARLVQRELGLARLEAEIDLFCASEVDEIAVLDPIFNLGPQATSLLERFARRGFRGRLSLQCRAEGLSQPFLEAAATLDVRLEFGLQTIHSEESQIIDRRNNLMKIEEALAEVRRRQIDHEVSLIFGLPGQTLASFEESICWCLERKVPVIKAFPLLLLRGTALERERDRWGYEDGGGEMPVAVRSATFSYGDWLAMARLSEALGLTEGQHPSGMGELRAMAAGLELDPARWQPGTIGASS